MLLIRAINPAPDEEVLPGVRSAPLVLQRILLAEKRNLLPAGTRYSHTKRVFSRAPTTQGGLTQIRCWSESNGNITDKFPRPLGTSPFLQSLLRRTISPTHTRRRSAALRDRLLGLERILLAEKQTYLPVSTQYLHSESSDTLIDLAFI